MWQQLCFPCNLLFFALKLPLYVSRRGIALKFRKYLLAVSSLCMLFSTGKVTEIHAEENTAVTYSAANTIDIYRMYNPNTGEHFYTKLYVERDSLMKAGWNYEGIGWTAPASDENGSTPVYRVYSPAGSDHFYTTSAYEKDMLVKKGWRDEGIAWYTDGLHSVPLYRQYNPKTGRHNFTVNKNENDNLVKNGWRSEGIAWYGVHDPDSSVSHPVHIIQGYDLSSIYDFNYYLSAYPDLVKAFGTTDDMAVLNHFWNSGLREGRIAKANYDQNVYNQLKNDRFPPEAEKVFNSGRCARNLRAAFAFAKMPYVHMIADPTKTTRYYAQIGYDRRQGNCYVMAGTFAELARDLGYNAVQCYGYVITRSGYHSAHSWVEIDGAVYDPDFAVELHADGFGFHYGDHGTLRYVKQGTLRKN